MVNRLKRAAIRSITLDAHISANIGIESTQPGECLDFFSPVEDDGDSLELNYNLEATDLNCINDLERLAATKFPPEPRTASEDMSLLRHAHRLDPVRISTEEVDAAVKTISRNTYHGSEGASFKTFIRAYEFVPTIIQTICKMSFYIAATPKCCQTTLGKSIPKKEAGKFRIVHQSSPLTVLLEKIALGRLQWAFERIGAYSVNQYAFTAGRNRNDLVAKIIDLFLDTD